MTNWINLENVSESREIAHDGVFRVVTDWKVEESISWLPSQVTAWITNNLSNVKGRIKRKVESQYDAHHEYTVMKKIEEGEKYRFVSYFRANSVSVGTALAIVGVTALAIAGIITIFYRKPFRKFVQASADALRGIGRNMKLLAIGGVIFATASLIESIRGGSLG